MKVKEIITTKVETITSSDPLKRAAELMMNRHCGSLPVIDGEFIAGILTDRDMAIRAIAGGKEPDSPSHRHHDRQSGHMQPEHRPKESMPRN